MSKWIIPDIHGCARTLEVLLENLLKVTKEDELFFLGDYIDRGPSGKEVIDYVMGLQANGYNVHCLKGNHEDYCIQSWEADNKSHLFKPKVQKEWEAVGASTTLKSFGVKRPRDIPHQYIDWMKDLKYYYELEHYILVHAGMNFKVKNPFEDTHSMIWTRSFKVDYSKTDGRRIIHGHIPVDYSFIDLVVRNPKGYDFIALDNGVFETNKPGKGNLMAFNPDDNTLIAQSNLDM